MAEPDFWKRLDRLTAEDLDDLVMSEQREHSTLDYKAFCFTPKASLLEMKNVADDICAMANVGGGRIVYGANEDGADRIRKFAPAPTDKLRGVLSTIRNATHAISPTPLVGHQVIKYPIASSESFLLVIEAKPTAAGPHQHRGRYLTRGSAANTYMNHADVVSSILFHHRQRRERSSSITPQPIHSERLGARFTTRAVGWWLTIDIEKEVRSPSAVLLDPLGDDATAIVERLASRSWDVMRTPHDLFGSQGIKFERTITIATNSTVSLCRLLGEPIGKPALQHKIEADIKSVHELLFDVAPSADLRVSAHIQHSGSWHQKKFSMFEELAGSRIEYSALANVSLSASCLKTVLMADMGDEIERKLIAKELVERFCLHLEEIPSVVDDEATK